MIQHIKDFKTTNTYNTFHSKLSFPYEEPEEVIGSIARGACWSKLKSHSYNNHFYKRYILISGVKYWKYRKYTEDVVKITNYITNCKLIECNNEKYIKYNVIGNYTSDLFILDFIRLLWWQPKILKSSEAYFKDVIKHVKETENTEHFDPFFSITSFISKYANEDKRAYYEGDHCFFYKEAKSKTSNNFERFRFSTESMSSFICS